VLYVQLSVLERYYISPRCKQTNNEMMYEYLHCDSYSQTTSQPTNHNQIRSFSLCGAIYSRQTKEMEMDIAIDIESNVLGDYTHSTGFFKIWSSLSSRLLFSGSCWYCHLAVSGKLIKMLSTRAPGVFRPKEVPLSCTRLNST
jgi:hypothetical protein